MYASFIVFIQRPRVSNDVTLTNTQVEIIPVICHGSSMFSNGQLNGGANSQLISKLLRGRWIRWRVAISHRFAIYARNSGRKIKKEFRGYWRIFNGNSVEIRSIFFMRELIFISTVQKIDGFSMDSKKFQSKSFFRNGRNGILKWQVDYSIFYLILLGIRSKVKLTRLIFVKELILIGTIQKIDEWLQWIQRNFNRNVFQKWRKLDFSNYSTLHITKDTDTF